MCIYIGIIETSGKKKNVKIGNSNHLRSSRERAYYSNSGKNFRIINRILGLKKVFEDYWKEHFKTSSYKLDYGTEWYEEEMSDNTLENYFESMKNDETTIKSVIRKIIDKNSVLHKIEDLYDIDTVNPKYLELTIEVLKSMKLEVGYKDSPICLEQLDNRIKQIETILS